jgi:hypothetical protein
MGELHRVVPLSTSRADAVCDLFFPPVPGVGQITKGHAGTRKGMTSGPAWTRGDVQRDRYLPILAGTAYSGQSWLRNGLEGNESGLLTSRAAGVEKGRFRKVVFGRAPEGLPVRRMT